MPCVGFILRKEKRARVLTPTLATAAQRHGLSLVALDPDSSPSDWRDAGVDVIVHKAPGAPGLDGRLEAFAAAQPGVVVLDPPAAVRALQDREAMLAPLLARQDHQPNGTAAAAAAGAGAAAAGTAAAAWDGPGSDGVGAGAGVARVWQPVVLTLQQAVPRPAAAAEGDEAAHESQPQQPQPQQPQQPQPPQQHRARVVFSAPRQVTLTAGCSLERAAAALAAAGMALPVLVKPLLGTPGDTPAAAAAGAASPPEPATGAASPAAGNGGTVCPGVRGGGGGRGGGFAAAAAQPPPAGGGHTLAVVWTLQGLAQLLAAGGEAAGQQQCQQQPCQQQAAGGVDADGAAASTSWRQLLALPLVLQEYVPHTALYKVYVMGPHCVLTRRTTLTTEALEAAAAAAAPDGKQGVVLLPRVSAVALPSFATDVSTAPPPPPPPPQQQQPPHGIGGQALGQQAPPPLVPGGQSVAAPPAGAAVVVADVSVQGDPGAPPLWAVQQLAAHFRSVLGLSLFNMDLIAPLEARQQAPVDKQHGQQAQKRQGQQQPAEQEQGPQWLVVDVNFFPGFDKVGGAEPLLAAFLADACRAAQQAARHRSSSAEGGPP